MDQPKVAKRVASILRSKGIREVESPGRVDQAVSGIIPIFIPAQ